MRSQAWKRIVLTTAVAGGCLFQGTCDLVSQTIGLALQIVGVWV
ncbi:hypothetical protein RAS1_10730 [Phycisphaerae bacterium RAS1]|nr:hypothetical protein RAS1_10730 [Phycisphaerae bacterium RAS1]